LATGLRHWRGTASVYYTVSNDITYIKVTDKDQRPFANPAAADFLPSVIIALWTVLNLHICWEMGRGLLFDAVTAGNLTCCINVSYFRE
jgi:hypothetical protein